MAPSARRIAAAARRSHGGRRSPHLWATAAAAAALRGWWSPTKAASIGEAGEEERRAVGLKHLHPAGRAGSQADQLAHAERAGAQHADQEEHEGPVICRADGLVDPRAVVVIPRHQQTAHRAHDRASRRARCVGDPRKARGVAQLAPGEQYTRGRRGDGKRDSSGFGGCR
eukprot:scaffold8736_cov114-Isochrysis_galbana.AAC.6